MRRRLIFAVVLAAGATACIGDVLIDPLPPLAVSARPGNGQVTLSWTDVAGASGYNLYWTADGSPSTVETGNRTADVANPFVHTGLTNDVLHRYVVTSYNDLGESSASLEASATPAAITGVGQTTVTFTLCCANSQGDSSIGYALWIEDAEGEYVDTVVYYFLHAGAPGYANAALPAWTSVAASTVDGISEASKYNGDQVTYVWDGTDRAGSPVAFGTYIFKLEITDWSPTAVVSSVTLELGEEAISTTATNPYVMGDITFDYVP